MPSLGFLALFSGVLISCFLTRSAFRLILHREVRVSDTYFHVNMVALVRKHGYWTASQSRPSYPLGFHWLAGKLSGGHDLLWERINGAVFDTFQVLLFVAVFIWFKGAADPLIAWVWAPLLLVFYPGWLHQGYGPRVYDGTERVFSEFLVAATFSSVWLFRTGNGLAWLVVASILGSFICLSSKFGVQALLFFCIAMAFTERSTTLIGVPFLAVLIALAMSRGLYWKVLRGHILHLTWYVRDGVGWAKTRNYPSTLVEHFRKERWLGVARYVLVTNSISVGLIHNIPLWIMLLSWRLGFGAPVPSTFAEHWLLAGLLFWALTSIPGLLFLGEPERYMLCAALPAYFLIGSWIASTPLWVRWAMLSYCVLWWLLQQLELIQLSRWKRPQPEMQKQNTEIINFLHSLPPSRLLTIGDSGFNWWIAFATHHEHWQMDPRLNSSISWSDVFSTYPFPRRKALELLDIDIVTVKKTNLDQAKKTKALDGWDFRSFSLVFENETYVSYTVDKAERTPRTSSVPAALE